MIIDIFDEFNPASVYVRSMDSANKSDQRAAQYETDNAVVISVTPAQANKVSMVLKTLWLSFTHALKDSLHATRAIYR
ncbi:MAG: hypothetical protein HON65_12060 [Rhodospirillales bacterium]|mgnify:FL=1|nr:hypothetical protein [Rhodospirillales bacterium]